MPRRTGKGEESRDKWENYARDEERKLMETMREKFDEAKKLRRELDKIRQRCLQRRLYRERNNSKD